MVKTTKNNPAAFQKIPQISLYMVLLVTAQKIFNGEIKVAIKLFKSKLMNYLSQYKRKNKFYCNLCKYESPYFLHTANKKNILYDSICPNCSSRKRHRGLNELYKKMIKEFDFSKILHFAPEPVFYKLFQPFEYITADLVLTDVDLQLNIENIDCRNDSFDFILCNHVLEHVSDDNKAFKELYRILKPSGILIITVPGNWKRDLIIEYDQPDSNGHFRDYGLNLIGKLNKIFTTVKSIDLYKYNGVYMLPIGLTPQHDLAFICRKD